MSLLAGFVSCIVGVCCVFLLPDTGQTQYKTSVSVEKVQSNVSAVQQKQQQSILQSTNKALDRKTVIQKQTGISRSSQQFLQNLPLPPSKQTEQVTTDPFAAILAYGWQEYKQKNYTQAKTFFLQAVASENAENRSSAEYGLLYSYLKLGNSSAALPLLQNFVARDEQLPSTAPLLATIFFERGDFDSLQTLFPKLSPEQKKEWQGRIVLALFRKDIAKINESSRTNEVKAFLRQYEGMIEACQEQEQFFRIASFLVSMSRDQAKKIFTDLSRCLPEDPHWQERLTREQLHLMSNKDLLAAAPSEETISKETWKRLYQDSLWLRLDQFEEGSSEYDSFVQVLYEQDRSNQKAASMAAWSCYQQKEYNCAQNIFSTLLTNNPSDDTLLGLVYTLQKKGTLAEALQLLEQHSNKKSTTFNQLRYDLHAAHGGNLYRSAIYDEAAVQLERALAYHPGDPEISKMLLWSRYHLGESKPIVSFLWQQYQEMESIDTAQSLSNLLGTLNEPLFTREIMASFADSEIAEVRKIAGDYAFQQKHPVLASQIYQGKSPYTGSAVPALDAMFHFRSKDGDDGTSSLNVATFIVKQRFSSHSGKTWSIALFPLSFDSGSLPENTHVGSAFRSPNQSYQSGLWQESVLAWGWRGGLHIEGDLNWDIRIGSTPVNGIIAPTPVGKIETIGSDWKIAVARDPVRDSMLSWIGQTDPYSGREWGRVVQTNLSGTKTISFNNWWLALEGKYGWYQGESVEQNSSLTTSISGGQTGNWGSFERSTGLFLFARGFQRNSNFYTFGHGGYYSPAQQIIVGPFLRFATPVTTPYWLEASCSAGLNYRKTDNAPRYTKIGAVDIAPQDPEWQDLVGTYNGESETGLGLDARVRGLLPISNGWFIGGEASINNVSDFSQWQLSVALRYRFGKGMGLGLPERDFSMITSLIQ